MNDKPRNLFHDFRTLLYLFIVLRVILLIVYQPQILELNDPDLPLVERGLTLLGDFREHYDFARRINADNLPYRDYWVEFPPVWHTLTWLVYKLVEPRGGDFTAWASVLVLLLLAMDAGNLVLIKKLGDHLHGPDIGMVLAWIYALLAAPMVMLAWNFEAIVAFSLLAGFYGYLAGKKHASSGIIAVGILTKYVPVLLLPTVWRFSPRRDAIVYTLIVVGLVAVVLIPLVIWGGQMAMTSLTVQFDKPSYQTMWALIDGNYGTGSFVGGAARYDAAAKPASGSAAAIAGYLRIIPFAVVGLWLFRLPLRGDAQTQLAFFTVTVTLFMLWAQGWSPQWTVTLVPLILLNFPSRVGVLLGLALMVGAFVEYPLLFRYTAETANQISGPQELPFALLVIARTVILLGISAVLVQKLRTA